MDGGLRRSKSLSGPGGTINDHGSAQQIRDRSMVGVQSTETDDYLPAPPFASGAWGPSGSIDESICEAGGFLESVPRPERVSAVAAAFSTLSSFPSLLASYFSNRRACASRRPRCTSAFHADFSSSLSIPSLSASYFRRMAAGSCLGFSTDSSCAISANGDPTRARRRLPAR